MKTSRPPHRDSDSTPRGDILATLEKLSLEDKLRRQRRAANQQLVQQSRGTLSQYQLNYQPMDKGVRKSLWEEGYRHRNDRKQLGFKHTKLEWRTPGMEDGELQNANRNKPAFKKPAPPLVPPLKDPFHLENLELPPTKLVRKRQKLQKIYERQKRKRMAARPKTAFAVDDPSKPLTNQGAGDVVCQKRRRPKSASSSYDESEISLVKLSSYDRNKRNNETSHIHMPTFESTVRSQDIDQEEDFSISSLSKFPVTDSKAPSSAGNELDAAETNQKQSSKEKKKGSSTSSGRRSSCSACGSVASM